ncbi:MAG TPA: helix-turn-helix transcriptional regulator [Ktedonobacterales bacterium]|nr:helix-turn-helix transcriptional regulator [Ktedonobacterales bacterium]
MATKDRGKPSTRAASKSATGRERGKAATDRSRRASQPAEQAPTDESAQSGTPGRATTPPTEVARRGRARKPTAREAERAHAAPIAEEHVVTPSAATETEHEASPDVAQDMEQGSRADAPEEPPAAAGRGARRDRHRTAHSNALGLLIERQFADPGSPCHSYSDLERRSGISREALSRYVTSRVDRRRSPTIDTLVAIADALHVSLEGVARAAAASVKGITPPPDEVQRMREEALTSLVAGLSDGQFNAVVELLRQLGP